MIGFRFKVKFDDPHDNATGFGPTEADARQNLVNGGYKTEEILELIEGPINVPDIQTDFAPDGPQPGSVAYTAFIMAQLIPTNEDEGVYDGFWDDWKDDVKDNLD